MRIQFLSPLFLLLAIPLIVHVIWMGRRLLMLSRARRNTSITIRLIIVLLLVLSLAGIRFTRHSDDLTVFFVLDESESIPELQRDQAIAYIKEAINEMDRQHDRYGVVAFGSDAALDTAPSSIPEFEQTRSVVDRTKTNIADAIQLALACFVGSGQKRIVLLSDGNQNAGDAQDLARSAAAANIVIDVVPLTYENRNDVIVEKVVVEPRVNLDEPLDISIIVSSREATEGKISIYQQGRLLLQDTVELQPGKNHFSIPTNVSEKGFHRFEVILDVEGDQIPENNRGIAFTFGEGEPKVLLVDGDNPISPALPAMLESKNVKVDIIGPSELRYDLRDLHAYDAVIFNNVAAGDISTNQMKMIERAVHDLGMGFIMIGGENSFGAGGYNDSPIERILPVNMEIKNEKILPKGALVPIIHTSEIPQAMYWGVQITIAALDVLSPRDEMGVLTYSWAQGGESWLYPLQVVGKKSRMRSLIQTMQIGDMPSFDKTLQMAYNALVNSDASVKHIIVISDGDPQTPNQALANKIKSASITISTVVISPHSPRDKGIMQNLAKWGGGRYYDVQNYNQLPQIFIKEAATVRKSLIIEEPFNPVLQQTSPILRSFGDQYPVLGGYVATSPKDLADIPLVTENDDPLLAHWRYGLGKTIAFTSDAKERWATAWVDWEQYAQFWAQAVRWSLRTPFNENYQVQIDSRAGKVIIDAVDDAGEFKNHLDFSSATISTPSLGSEKINVRQVGPGRYEADFDITEPGTYMFGAEVGADIITGGTSVSYSPEFQHSKSNAALLGRLSDITNGRTLDTAGEESVFLHNLESQSEPRSLWPMLLSALLVLFLADVFVRRVIIGWSEVSAGWAIASSWMAERLGRHRLAPAGATEQLLRMKQGLRSEEQAAPMVREDFLASLREVKVEKSPLAEALPRAGGFAPRVLKPARATAVATEGEGSFTSQLLEARSRAQARMKKKPMGDDRT